ncbi:hypothetical protein NTE_02231 [Candidatus Nitrososphaera evergladensis SR1]|uniref:Uncharacterized protein n=1 Tax=Candidatus Nitrososphaera evergladensis SR1 TaxID=1459636 RepID=A0A075MSX8_9ARCH|nr:M12 family metallo-peptidase [Candidatus Nitrososphaera evergladensis]AIF84285.1 hypothetical protein NTE_02231 [Candidatus Nitrososphaera evergladensis SR1]
MGIIVFSVFASANSSLAFAVPTANPDPESLVESKVAIERSFSTPLLRFNGETAAQLMQKITWFPNGTTALSDDQGSQFTFTLDLADSSFVLLSNSTMIDQKVLGKDHQYDIVWKPLRNSDGAITKYKFDIVGTSANGHTIKLLLSPQQEITVNDDSFLSLSKNYNSNSTSLFGVGLDWSDATSAGQPIAYDSEERTINIPVGKSYFIDPTTISTITAVLSPGSSDYYEGERREVRIGNVLFMFYFDGSNIVYRSSLDFGATWSSATSSGSGVINGDVHRYTVTTENVTGTNYVTLLYFKTSGSNTNFYGKRGTVGLNTITWNNETSMFSAPNFASCGTSVCAASVGAVDTSGIMYAAFRWIPSGASSYQYQIMKSANGGLGWNTSLSQIPADVGTRIEMFLTPLASGKMLFGYMRYTTDDIKYRLWDGTGWSAENTVGNIGSTANTIKHVSADSDGVKKAYVAYLTGGNSGSIKIAKWGNDGSWLGNETADSTLSHTLPSITITNDGVIHVYSLSGNKVYDTTKILNSWQTPTNPFGTTFTSPAQLTSGSGYPMALWIEGSSSPFNLRFDRTDWDVDRDGIYNNWEVNGIDSNWDGTVDFLPSSSQAHKDIFVEIDYMQNHQPDSGAINNVTNAFANAPITNPDSTTGITLHLNLDEQVTHSDTTSWPTGFNSIKPTHFGTATERAAANHDNILNAKKKIYHYNLWVHSITLNGPSGVGELLGNDFMVSMGSYNASNPSQDLAGSREHQAGTLMHELGHNLGLHHGGGVDINCKPNYLSVMNYAFQLPTFVSDRPLDYSRSQLLTLDEINLDELDGVSASTPSGLKTVYGKPGDFPVVSDPVPTGQGIDWNRDEFLGDDGVEQSINFFDIPDCDSLDLTSLTGYNDWANVQLAFTSSGTYANGTSVKVVDNEMTREIVQKMQLMTLDTIDHLLQNANATSFRDTNDAAAEKKTLHDVLDNPVSGAKAAVRQDNYGKVVAILERIRAKLDASVGGDPHDDMIVNQKEQTRILQQLDNVITSFKKAWQ